MALTTRGGKHTIDPHMSSVVKGDMSKGEKVVEASGEFMDKMAKETDLSQRIVPIAISPPPFSQRIVKKT